MTVKRYDLKNFYCGKDSSNSEIVPTVDGVYVKYEDYEILFKKLEALQKSNSTRILYEQLNKQRIREEVDYEENFIREVSNGY